MDGLTVFPASPWQSSEHSRAVNSVGRQLWRSEPRSRASVTNRLNRDQWSAGTNAIAMVTICRELARSIGLFRRGKLIVNIDQWRSLCVFWPCQFADGSDGCVSAIHHSILLLTRWLLFYRWPLYFISMAYLAKPLYQLGGLSKFLLSWSNLSMQQSPPWFHGRMLPSGECGASQNTSLGGLWVRHPGRGDRPMGLSVLVKNNGNWFH